VTITPRSEATTSSHPSDRDERNERVIHARVPESLDDEIRRRAGRLGLSVSNLVRNVLQNAFGLVEDIVHDSAEIARSARLTNDRGARRPARVVGWQTARLAQNAVCERCNAILPRGSEAALGIVASGGATRIRCLACEGRDDDEAVPRVGEDDDGRS
jgi:hypothetical protein